MTGWRLGWMVVPPHLVDAMNRLSQNIYINAPSLSQIAAIAAFSDESTAELEGNLQRYKDNRQIVLDVLCDLGTPPPPPPSPPLTPPLTPPPLTPPPLPYIKPPGTLVDLPFHVGPALPNQGTCFF